MTECVILLNSMMAVIPTLLATAPLVLRVRGVRGTSTNVLVPLLVLTVLPVSISTMATNVRVCRGTTVRTVRLTSTSAHL